MTVKNHQRLRIACLITGSITFALLCWVNNAPYFFRDAGISVFKQWFPGYYKVVYPIARSFIFMPGFLTTIVVGSLFTLLISFWITHRNEIKENAILLLLSFSVSLAVAEFFFRQVSQYKSYPEATGISGYVSPYTPTRNTWLYTYLPGKEYKLKTHEFENTWTTNSEGLHEAEIPVQKTTIRILALGDSYTEGMGTKTDSSYPRRLEVFLKEAYPTPVQVINAGVAGSDPFFAYQLLKQKMLKYQPDMVVVMVNPSDISDVAIRGGIERFKHGDKIKYKQSPWFEPVYAHSFLVRELVHKVWKYDNLFRTKQEAEQSELEAFNKLTVIMDSFSTLCKVKDIELCFAFLPYADQLRFGYDKTTQHLINHCAEKKLNTIDLKNYLHQSIGAKTNVYNYYWKIDGHCTGLGYNTIARCISQHIAVTDTTIIFKE